MEGGAGSVHLDVWNDTSRPFPSELPLHRAFERQVATNAAATAAEYGEQRITYGALNARANQLAHRLRELGVAPDSLVGLCFERSIDLLVTVLAILKAGAAYVPLDPGYPGERLRAIVDDARLSTIVCHSALAGRLPPTAARILQLDREDAALDVLPTTDLALELPGTSLAYVNYTSGSTGRPKGIGIPHRAVQRLLIGTDYVELGPTHRIAQASNTAFDAATFEIWGALLHGGCLVGVSREVALAPARYAELIERARISVVFMTTALFNQFARERPTAFRSLRYLLFGGEACDPKAVREVLARGAPANLLHVYGPTEVTTFATWYPVTSVEPSAITVPIGRPLANTTGHVLDASLRPVGPGEVGELYLGGPGLARGYIGRPDLTAERFIPDPFARRAGERLYATGDRVRLRADGELEFVGRLDHQVKVRGFRIELGEIEAALAQAPGVQDAVVLVREDLPGEKRLIAYVTGAANLESARLREHLTARLPEFMVPAAFVVLDRFPLNAHGKVDRAALPQPSSDRGGIEGEYVAPRNDVERTLAEIWSELLGVARVGVNDNFFELGGDSITALRVIARAGKLGLRLEPKLLFGEQTIAAIASALPSVQAAPADPHALPITLTPADPGVVQDGYPLTATQQGMLFHTLEEPQAYLEHLGFELAGPLDPQRFRAAWREVIRHHPVLRTCFRWQDLREPLQLIQAEFEPEWRTEDWRALASAEQDAKLARFLEQDRQRGFGLTQPPQRFALFLLDANRARLVWTFHHALLDGWSRSLVLKQVFDLYRTLGEARPAHHLPASRPFRDYVGHVRGQDTSAAETFFRQFLAGANGTQLALVSGTGTRGREEHALELDDVESHALSLAARSGRFTLSTLAQAAWALVLSRYTGERDVVFGTTFSGRPPDFDGVEQLVGLCINTLPVRVQVTGSVRSLLERVRTTFDQLRPFEHTSLKDVRRWALVEGELFNSILVFENYPEESWLDQRDQGFAVSSVLDQEQVNYPFALYVIPGERIALKLVHDGSADGAAARAVLTHLKNALTAMTSPDRSLDSIALLTPEEQAALSRWNATFAQAEREPCVPDLFEAQVDRTPDRIALHAGGVSLRYAELEARANQLAHHLRALGVGPEDRVGICLERSVDLVVALLAVHKAGGAYVPLDLAHPAERIALIAEEARAAVVLTQTSLAGRLAQLGTPKLLLDAEADAIARRPATRPVRTAVPQGAAYVLYTSGSTGKPKGVVVEHRNVASFFRAMEERLGPSPGVWAALTGISFDISVLELLWTLCHGHEVVLVKDALSRAPASAARTRPIAFSLFYFGTDGSADPAQSYHLLLEGARFADTHGFEAVWTPERHFFEFGGLYPNPAVTGAAIAASTRRVAIRAGSVVSPLQNTLRIAEEWSLVDNLSHGRVGVAFASGWHADDFVLAPENYARRHAVMAEQIDQIRRLWTGQTLSFRNGLGKEIPVGIRPRPIQPHLPMWITTSGTRETFRKAGQLGANVLTHLLGQDRKALAENIAVYREARRAAGHAGEGRVSVMLHTFVGADTEQVRELVREPFKSYLRSSVELIRALPEVGKVSNLSKGEVPSGDDLEAVLDAAFQRYFDSAGLFGAPERCAALARGLADLGVDEIACLVDFGVSTEKVIASFAELERARELAQSDGQSESLSVRMSRHGVTHLQCTPSLARALLLDPEVRAALAGVRTWLVGGEALPSELALEMQSAFPGTLLNVYGPTETTVWSSSAPVRGAEVVLGTPLANTELHVIDHAGQRAPIGAVGELFIGGEGVARGYLDRPELTAERFVPDPFSGRPGARLYRTGDLVRRTRDGALHFLGRADHQIKIRGHRVELGEIESRLAAHADVAQAVVIAREDVPGEQRLLAYVVSRSGSPDPEALRQWVGRLLPDPMVPAAVVFLDALPLTPNGKVDRKRLPAPQAPKRAARDDRRQGEMETAIATLFAEVLGLESVRRDDDFFELGGHSMLATQLASRVKAALGVPLPVRRVFEAPTVAGLAELLARSLPPPRPAAPVDTAGLSDREVEELLKQMMGKESNAS